MSDYGNYSSDDDSDDDIGLPKTPGAPLNANRSDSEKEDDDNHNDDERSNHSNDNRANSDSSSDSYQSDNDDDDDDEVNRSDGPNNINDDSSDKKSVSSHNGSDAQKSSDESSSNGDSDDEANIQSRKDNNDDDNDRHSNASSNQSRKHQDSSSDESNQENKDKFGKKRKTMIDSSSSDDDGDEDENKSREGESETKKPKPSTEEDLFGELSDEDDDDNDRDAEHRTKEKPTINDDNDDEDDINREIVDANMNEIFGGGGDDDDDERMDEEQEAPIPETRIEVEIPRITADLGESIHFVKLPNFLSIDTHPYDPQWYEDEIDEDEVHDDEGRARLKLKVENTIRWRNVDGDPNLRESNARIVKWSDGSMSLHLGDEIFDIQKFNLLPGENNHLYIRQGTGLQGQSVFKTKLTFRPFSTESVTHRKLTMSLADRSQKTQKICVLPTVGKDPEAHRSEMIKKEEIKLKAMIRKEIKAKRIKDRAYTRGVSSSFIEFDDEDDENISISKIKNQYKRGSNPQYSDDDYDNESVDKNKDNDDDDDDSDLDIFDKKKTAERRKILVDSDEDDD